MSGAPPVISISDMTFSYGSGRPVLESVSLEVHAQDFLAVVGPNGSGKTTLLRLILGLLRPDSGTVRVQGKPPRQACGVMGYVPQFANFDRGFPANALDVVLMGLLSQTRHVGVFTGAQRGKARAALESVGAGHLRRAHIGSLSGGQVQRVLLARALVSDPAILLLDEPTASIDVQAEETFFDLLHRLNETVTIVLVSHDIGFITAHVNRVACVNRTLVCHPTSETSSQIIASMYDNPVEFIEHQLHVHNEAKRNGSA